MLCAIDLILISVYIYIRRLAFRFIITEKCAICVNIVSVSVKLNGIR